MNVRVLCVGEAQILEKARGYLEEHIEDISGSYDDCEMEYFEISEVTTGDKTSTLTFRLPMVDRTPDLEYIFKDFVKNFREISLFAAGYGECDDMYLIINDYYAATEGKTIATQIHEYPCGNEDDEEDFDFDDAHQEAENQAQCDYCEFLIDFYNDSVADHINLFQDKNLCKKMIELCYLTERTVMTVFSMQALEFPRDFWLDPECRKLVPDEDWNDIFIQADDKFWDDEEVCIALAKVTDEALDYMSDEMQQKVKQAIGAGSAAPAAPAPKAKSDDKDDRQSATAIKISGKKILRTIRKEFQGRFPFLGLSFQTPEQWKQGKEKGGVISLLPDDKKLAEVRTVPPPKEGKEISIHGRTLVKNLKDTFLKTYGLYVQVTFQKGDTVYYTNAKMDDMSLTQLNNKMKEDGCVKKPGNASKK